MAADAEAAAGAASKAREMLEKMVVPSLKEEEETEVNLALQTPENEEATKEKVTSFS